MQVPLVVNAVTSKSDQQLSSELMASFAITRRDGLCVCKVSDPLTLKSMIEEWTELARESSTDNSFYEPGFFLAAATHIEEKANWHVFLIWDEHLNQLVGFFPFVLTKGPGGLRKLELWKSSLSFLTTPLIRSGREREVLDRVFDDIQSMKPRIDLLEFPCQLETDRISQELHMLIRERLLATFQYDFFSRAELRPDSDCETYLKQSIGGHHFRGYRRQLRRLNDLGQLEFRSSRSPELSDCWATWFLDLEEKGWKGREGTAMQQHPQQSQFFRELISGSSGVASVEMFGLFLNGEPIALACNLNSAQGAFTYKITFDENYKKFSPGILLQLHIMQQFFEQDRLRWLDSCAVPNHPMINRLWTERRSIEHLLVSTGKPVAELLLGAMPFVRNCKRLLRSRKQTTQSS